jgi:hypothetical protein
LILKPDGGHTLVAIAEQPVAAAPTAPQRPRRFHWEWIFPVLFRPRPTFREIAAQNQGVWYVPILLLTVSFLVYALATAYAIDRDPNAGMPNTDDMMAFEWYTPEQQAQLQQQMAGMRSPVINYGLRSLWMVASVWFGWLVIGGLLHLMLTLFGGRSSTGSTMNVVAWASLPLVFLALLRTGFFLIEKRPLRGPGISGFAPQGEGILASLAAEFMALVTIWLIWQIILLVIGVRQSSQVSRVGAWASALITILFVMLVQAGGAVAIAQIQGLTVTQGPMF